MTFRPAARLGAIEVSPIIAVMARARALKAAGRDVIALGFGEPDFDTPEHVQEATIAAMRRGETRYTAIDGTPALKQAIAHKFATENGLTYAPEEITVATGAKQVIYNAMMATLDDGDEVIIPAPYWSSYLDIALIAGGRPVVPVCSQQDGFKLTPAALAGAITPRTRWLFLNSPSNPTGAAYSAAELAALAEVLRAHDHVWVMSDDIYEHLRYGDTPFATIAAVAPDLKPRVLTLNGVSKAYCMTGWRLGYAGGPAALVKAMAVVQSQSTSSPSSLSQAGAVAALSGPQDLIAEHNAIFRERRDLVVAALNRIAGVECPVPDGAFYVYPSVAGLIGRRTAKGALIASDADLVAYLLEEADVAVVPGSAFGLSPHVRLSYATDTATLAEACRRIAVACSVLK
ncbi:MAG: pyridoxal phosphate-dependent aminotransferase [Alphaproteobacteria bacterium]|jgi:aspartate aminotransferase|nr:pyridoxal phosphate-dependent aminotransferase [Alphaproteobacteria bacterium]